MRKGCGLLFFVFIIIFVFYIRNYLNQFKETKPVIFPSPTVIETPITPANILNLQFEGKDYNLYFSKLSGRRAELLPNFSQKATSRTIVSEANCKVAVNGGFYTKEGEPLGLYIANGRIYKEEEKANKSLLTGFFYTDETGIHISDKAQKSLNIIQSGPFMTSGNKFPTTVDEPARRIVIAEDANGILYALAITAKEDFYKGPTLADLPNLLFSISVPFKINRALNMDGGAASVYYAEDGFNIQELTSVGSIICFK